VTFSIIGYDPETEALGIAVQSKFIGVGAVVPWAKAGVGAVATQSFANPAYGQDGLKLMAEGKSAEETIDIITANDDGKEYRQVGIMDATGHAATFTGNKCYDWAGGMVGEYCVAQGNILVQEEVVTSMINTFEQETGKLADRLLKALDAGQEAGGDRRGKQAAALLVVREKGGYLQANDRMIDLRVDEHPDPIKELTRIYKLHRLYFGVTKKENILNVSDVRTEIVNHLYRRGFLLSKHVSDQDLNTALGTFHHVENFEGRELGHGKIDKEVLEFLTSS